LKITSESLGEVRVALIEQSATLDAQTKSAAEAVAARDKTSATVRSLQGSFDICAQAYASDSELSTGQLEQLPSAVQAILGYTPAKTAPSK
jgi:hypothetical protein